MRSLAIKLMDKTLSCSSDILMQPHLRGSIFSEAARKKDIKECNLSDIDYETFRNYLIPFIESNSVPNCSSLSEYQIEKIKTAAKKCKLKQFIKTLEGSKYIALNFSLGNSLFMTLSVKETATVKRLRNTLVKELSAVGVKIHPSRIVMYKFNNELFLSKKTLKEQDIAEKINSLSLHIKVGLSFEEQKIKEELILPFFSDLTPLYSTLKKFNTPEEKYRLMIGPMERTVNKVVLLDVVELPVNQKIGIDWII